MDQPTGTMFSQINTLSCFRGRVVLGIQNNMEPYCYFGVLPQITPPMMHQNTLTGADLQNNNTNTNNNNNNNNNNSNNNNNNI